VTFKIAAAQPANDSLIISKDTTVHAVVNQMPEFPGGQQVLFDYLSKNIRYPDKANGAQGRVIVTFVVEQDGSISNVVIAKSSGNKWLDQEGIRLIKSMPKWKPGRLKGEIVRVKYSVPITFSKE
jgi:TonB family protein